MRWREKRPSLQRCKSIEDFFFRRSKFHYLNISLLSLSGHLPDFTLLGLCHFIYSTRSIERCSWGQVSVHVSFQRELYSEEPRKRAAVQLAHGRQATSYDAYTNECCACSLSLSLVLFQDEREQFKCQFMMREAEADDENDSVAAATILFPEYVSVWCALDDCSASNGALAFATNTRVLELDCSSNTLFSGNKRKHGHHHLFDGLPSFIPDTKIRADTSNWGLGSPMVIPAGTAVLFSSRTWYTISISVYRI